MTTQAPTGTLPAPVPPAAGGASTPPAPPPPPVVPPPPAPPPPPVAPVPPVPGDTSTASLAKPIADDQDTKPGELVALSHEALMKRVGRATKAQLKAEFGTDDPAAIKTQLAELATFKAEQEKQRLAALSNEQRLTEERNTAIAQRDAAVARAQEVEDSRAVESVAAEIKTVAVEYINPKHFKYAQADLAEHLDATYGIEKLDKMTSAETEKAVRDFFVGYVKDNPEFAKPGTPAPVVTTTTTTPLTNGNANPKGPPGKDMKPPAVITTGRFAGKTAAPGHPNSMTKQEFEAWKRETGNNF